MIDTLREYAKLPPDQAKTLPADFYTSADFLAFEEENLFRKEWVGLGREDEIPNPGDYFTTEVLGEPLLIVRGKDQKVRVLSNVCRHRGMLIAEGKGSRNIFTCPYHAWSYRDDGSLLRASLMEDVAGFESTQCRLPEFTSELWGGFIFVNLDGTATPLFPRLEGLDSIIKNYHISEMNHAFSEEVTWGTNWKSLVENFMEGYHLSVVHSKTLRDITPTALCEKFPPGPGYMGYKSHYPDSLPERGACHPDVTEKEKRYSVMFCVYPNVVIGLCPHQVVYMCLRPTGVGSVSVRWGIADYGNNTDEEESNNRLEFYRKVNGEDKAMLEKVQIGLKSRAYNVTSPLAPPDYEGTIWDFFQYVSRTLTGERAEPEVAPKNADLQFSHTR